jgi:NTP pyrophosphatase (non-canonical NTP hydrolase)
VKNRDYEAFVATRCKPGEEIANFSARDKHIAHMIFGIAGEVGELVDAFKKYLIYDQPLDMSNVEEECGDLEFYLAGLRMCLFDMGGSTRPDILAANVAKLSARYPEGYTNKDAADRADKVS